MSQNVKIHVCHRIKFQVKQISVNKTRVLNENNIGLSHLIKSLGMTCSSMIEFTFDFQFSKAHKT